VDSYLLSEPGVSPSRWSVLGPDWLGSSLPIHFSPFSGSYIASLLAAARELATAPHERAVQLRCTALRHRQGVLE